jgi:hypothetical protein
LGTKLAQEGAAILVHNINKKIEQLGEEQLHLINNIQIITNTVDGYTKQVRAISDQDAPLDDMQSTVHTFLLKALAKANTSSADSNAQMTAIFEKIAEHKTELRAFSNDGLGLHDNIFAEESKPTNRTVHVKDSLLHKEKRDIADVIEHPIGFLLTHTVGSWVVSAAMVSEVLCNLTLGSPHYGR